MYRSLSQCGQMLLKGFTTNLQQTRNTVIMKRKFPPPLSKLNSRPRKLRARHNIYEIVEVAHMKKTPKLEVILTDYVEGHGIRGDRILVDRVVARRQLLPTGQAVYASPENIAEFERELRDRGPDEKSAKLTAYCMKTIRELQTLKLFVPMNRNTEWTLSKKHIRIAFRYTGVIVPEEAITLPEDEITHRSAELPFKIAVSVNELDPFEIDTEIFLIDNDDIESTGKHVPTEIFTESSND
ncbi:large ribosomal subunit protein bL9m-like [Tubulanus polymorphus]|uniref:large ribosomal subunit protein bL9m-like n=1 Tax=Tubulanus polymorphus TaxID=672921 RepID=UPI003DA24119